MLRRNQILVPSLRVIFMTEQDCVYVGRESGWILDIWIYFYIGCATNECSCPFALVDGPVSMSLIDNGSD